MIEIKSKTHQTVFFLRQSNWYFQSISIHSGSCRSSDDQENSLISLSKGENQTLIFSFSPYTQIANWRTIEKVYFPLDDTAIHVQFILILLQIHKVEW